MRDRTLWIALLVPVAVLAAATSLIAGPDERGPRARHHALGERIAEYLELSPEQQVSWKSLREQHEVELEPLRQEARELHQQLRAALDADNPDPAAVGAATLALKEHRKKLEASHDALESRLTAILSADQKAKLEAFKAASGAGHGPERAFRRRRSRGSEPAEEPTPRSGTVESQGRP